MNTFPVLVLGNCSLNTLESKPNVAWIFEFELFDSFWKLATESCEKEPKLLVRGGLHGISRGELLTLLTELVMSEEP